MFLTKRPIQMRFLFCLFVALSLALPSNCTNPYSNCFSCSLWISANAMTAMAIFSKNNVQPKLSYITTKYRTLTKPTSCDANVQKLPPKTIQFKHTTRTKNPFQWFCPYVRSLTKMAGYMVENVTTVLHLCIYLTLSCVHSLQMEHHGRKHCRWALKVVSEEHIVGWRGRSGKEVSLESSLTLSWTLDIRFNHQNIHTLISSTPYGD